jgi:1,4-dihydroxy-2-naphthoate octaprenyltransferase
MSIACGFVIDALLIVNNYRDRDNDRQVGKRTLVVRIGEENSRNAYLCVGVTACILNGAAWIAGHPLAFFLPLLYLVLHVMTYLDIKRINRGKALNRCLGHTARNILVYGLTCSLGLLLL